jgi:hypothetical protein
MKYLFWCSGLSALVLGYIFLQSSQVPPPQTQTSDIPRIPNPEPTILEQAKTSANQDRLKQAITLADTLPTTSEQYPIAQQLREVWARELLQRAINKYVQADLSIALKMLAAIPLNTSSFGQSLQLTRLWQQEQQVAGIPPQTITRPVQKIALPPPIVQPAIIPSIPTRIQPPPRVAVSQPSAAVRQEDQRILETLSTIPSHWNQLQRQQAVKSIVKAFPQAKHPLSPPEFSSIPQFSPPKTLSRLNSSPPSAYD